MKANARQAYNELLKLGAPVYDRQEYGAQFLLGGELRTNDDTLWADYWQEEIKEHWHPEDLDKPITERRINNAFGIRTKVHEILKAKALHAEWINGGLVGIYF